MGIVGCIVWLRMVLRQLLKLARVTCSSWKQCLGLGVLRWITGMFMPSSRVVLNTFAGYAVSVLLLTLSFSVLFVLQPSFVLFSLLVSVLSPTRRRRDQISGSGRLICENFVHGSRYSVDQWPVTVLGPRKPLLQPHKTCSRSRVSQRHRRGSFGESDSGTVGLFG